MRFWGTKVSPCMDFAKLKRFFLGEPLSSHRMQDEKIPKWKALAVLSSDALSSVAYATEAILIPLVAFSTAALVYSVPVGLAIGALLLIVSTSYRQTIEAYPNGGGAYVVASQNLGILPGLVAGAALLIGYVLTVSVSVSAGVEAIVSAFPEFQDFRVTLGVCLILMITVLNLRGIRESATIFAFPTYLFIFSFFGMLLVGGWRVLTGEVEPVQPVLTNVYPAIPGLLLMRAFSSGCAALTGIEAISNGVPAFKHPAPRNAKITLTWMAVIMVLLFFGITSLSQLYGILPAESETAVSQLARSILGEGLFYYVIQISTALILILAANTSYAGFPWLASVLAKDRYLPRQMAVLGDKLVFSNSIIGLSITSAFLLILFGGDTHSLLPLYALGVFLGFTLSQVGMLRHHLRERKEGWGRGFAINFVGAMTTFLVMIVVGLTKFSEGAWIVVVLIPILVLIFMRIHKHYLDIGRELTLEGVPTPNELEPYQHTAIVPISGVHRGVVEAIRYALSISNDVRAVYVEINPEATERMKATWAEWAHDVPLVVLKSPYRSLVKPLLDYLDDLEQITHGDVVTIIIPEFVTKKWWHQALHNQTAFLIRAALMFKPRKVVTSVRYHLKNT